MFMTVPAKLQNPKIFGFFLISMMVMGILLSPVLSSLSGGVTIRSSGTINITASNLNASSLSQYRAMFFQSTSEFAIYGYGSNGWSIAASTCAQYGINVAVFEIDDESNMPIPWTTTGTNAITWNITGAVTAMHQYGIQCWADFDFMIESRNSSEQTGTLSGTTGGLEICDPQASQTLKQIVQEIMTNEPFDGFLVDYNYWQYAGGGQMGATDGPFDSYSQANFGSWLQANYGKTLTSFPSQVDSTSAVYYSYWVNWRVYMIDQLMANVTQWVHAIKPNAPIASSAFDIAYLPGVSPAYWVLANGQDAGYWISHGYVNVIMPMCYNDQKYGDSALAWEQYDTGGSHGECALVFCLTDGATSDSSVPTADWVKTVNSVIANGSDGWMLWAYGGPGCSGGYTNVVPYLQAVNAQGPPYSSPTFSMAGIGAQNASSTSEQISWQTSLSSMGKVEYSTSPLFTSAWVTFTYNWNYTQVTYDPGTIVSSSANVTSHSITLTGLTAGIKYYFRVQSQDPSGTATSKVLTFNTGIDQQPTGAPPTRIQNTTQPS
jgi:hypothetical protein